ncbi:MAG: zinc ribbon domain-containing protein, partial [Anaerolineae bacterium]|nr:zinc ribbon domain-containing protein [Anaerolineae bacterium]
MPQLDESAQRAEDAPRCPSCGKRVRAEMSVCPACGLELLPRRTRIRCKRCGSRIPADATVCPRCKGDPRTEGLSAILIRGAVILFGVLVLVGIGLVLVRAVSTNVLRASTPSPTGARVTVIQVVHVVATTMPPPTFTPTIVATSTPSGRAS